MSPSQNKTVPSLEAVFSLHAVILELDILQSHSVNNIIVVHLRQSRNCTLLYSCTILLHSRTRPPTTLRLHCAVPVKFWYRVHACTGVGRCLSMS